MSWKHIYHATHSDASYATPGLSGSQWDVGPGGRHSFSSNQVVHKNLRVTIKQHGPSPSYDQTALTVTEL